jgi:hypothetical protein
VAKIEITIILSVFEEYLTSIDDPAMPFWSSHGLKKLNERRGESLAPVALRKCIPSGDGISWLYRKDLELAWWRMYTNFVRPWDRWMMKCGSGFHWIFRYVRSILMLDWGLPAVSRAVKMSSVGYRYKSVYCRISIDANTLCMYIYNIIYTYYIALTFIRITDAIPWVSL